MNHNLYTTLLSLAISGALLIVGMMAAGQAPRLSDATGDDLQVQRGETPAAEATAKTMTLDERKRHRRSRASLSMPYFSFAQSLRPRG
ncbi:MAG TPA: hypothetical protein VIT22_12210 [Pseudoxanthomonas sp.]